MTSPKISVIIPVYNAAPYLRECLDSVVNQTLRDLEIICIDDGSIDASPAILDEYAAGDPRIIVIRQENRGLSAVRKRGIETANGEYIGFVDSDDHIDLQCYETSYRAARENNADLVVWGGVSFPAVEWTDDNLNTRDIVYKNDPFTALFHETGSRVFVWNKLYHRKLFASPDVRTPEDISIGEDQDLMFRVFPKANTIIYISNKLYYYRQLPESMIGMINKQPARKMNMHIRLAKDIYLYWKDHDYLVGHEKDFSEWLTDFLYDTLLLSRNDIRFIGMKMAVEILDELNGSDIPANVSDRYVIMKQFVEQGYRPFVSFIIPVRDGGRRLPEIVQYLSAIDFPDAEFVFFDNDSTDNSLRLLEKFAAEDFRVMILSSNDRDADPEQIGMEKAKGKHKIYIEYSIDTEADPQRLQFFWKGDLTDYIEDYSRLSQIHIADIHQTKSELMKTKSELIAVREKLKHTNRYLENVESSSSHRIGRMITYIPRKCQMLLHLLKTHNPQKHHN